VSLDEKKIAMISETDRQKSDLKNLLKLLHFHNICN